MSATKVPARQRLLDAADKLFYSEGVHTVGIDRVIEEAGVAKGSSTPHTVKVAKITKDQVRQIAETKQADLNANDIEAASKIIAGTARSMGITTEA